ncbi:hypothetical protein, partial [Escherichia coli]|uniref:hypothetical protein n=2 Tax=Escherichia coli TaxID=562 RepID=UPI0020367386
YLSLKMKCILTKCFLFSEYNMACTEPTLSITYDELLEHTKEILYTLRMYSNTPPDSFDRGCYNGAIILWHKLVMQMSAEEKQCQSDHRLLRLLSGLSSDEQGLTDNVQS